MRCLLFCLIIALPILLLVVVCARAEETENVNATHSDPRQLNTRRPTNNVEKTEQRFTLQSSSGSKSGTRTAPTNRVRVQVPVGTKSATHAEAQNSRIRVQTPKPGSQAGALNSRANVPNSRANVPNSRDKVPNSRDNVPNSRDKVPNNRAEVPNSRAEVPNSRDNVPNSRANVPNSRAKVPYNRAEVPNSRANVPNSRANVPNNRAEVPNNRANVPNSRANVPNSRDKVPNSRAEVPNSRANVPNSRAEVPNSRANVPNSRDKVPNSRANVPNSRANVPNSRAKVWNSRANVPNSRAKVPNSRAEVPNNRAEVPNSRAEVRTPAGRKLLIPRRKQVADYRLSVRGNDAVLVETRAASFQPRHLSQTKGNTFSKESPSPEIIVVQQKELRTYDDGRRHRRQRIANVKKKQRERRRRRRRRRQRRRKRRRRNRARKRRRPHHHNRRVHRNRRIPHFLKLLSHVLAHEREKQLHNGNGSSSLQSSKSIGQSNSTGFGVQNHTSYPDSSVLLKTDHQASSHELPHPQGSPEVTQRQNILQDRTEFSRAIVQNIVPHAEVSVTNELEELHNDNGIDDQYLSAHSSQDEIPVISHDPAAGLDHSQSAALDLLKNAKKTNAGTQDSREMERETRDRFIPAALDVLIKRETQPQHFDDFEVQGVSEETSYLDRVSQSSDQQEWTLKDLLALASAMSRQKLKPHHRRRHRRRHRRDSGNIFTELMGLDPYLDDVIDDFIGAHPMSRMREKRRRPIDDIFEDRDRKYELQRIALESYDKRSPPERTNIKQDPSKLLLSTARPLSDHELDMFYLDKKINDTINSRRNDSLARNSTSSDTSIDIKTLARRSAGKSEPSMRQSPSKKVLARRSASGNKAHRRRDSSVPPTSGNHASESRQISGLGSKSTRRGASRRSASIPGETASKTENSNVFTLSPSAPSSSPDKVDAPSSDTTDTSTETDTSSNKMNTSSNEIDIESSVSPSALFDLQKRGVLEEDYGSAVPAVNKDDDSLIETIYFDGKMLHRSSRQDSTPVEELVRLAAGSRPSAMTSRDAAKRHAQSWLQASDSVSPKSASQIQAEGGRGKAGEQPLNRQKRIEAHTPHRPPLQSVGMRMSLAALRHDKGDLELIIDQPSDVDMNDAIFDDIIESNRLKSDELIMDDKIPDDFGIRRKKRRKREAAGPIVGSTPGSQADEGNKN